MMDCGKGVCVIWWLSFYCRWVREREREYVCVCFDVKQVDRSRTTTTEHSHEKKKAQRNNTKKKGPRVWLAALTSMYVDVGLGDARVLLNDIISLSSSVMCHRSLPRYIHIMSVGGPVPHPLFFFFLLWIIESDGCLSDYHALMWAVQRDRKWHHLT